MEGLDIRAAQLSDLEAIDQLEQRVFPLPWSRPQLRAELEVGHGRTCYVALDTDRQVVGYLLARQTVDEIEIFKLASAPAVQRTGTASALLTRLRADQPAAHLHLEVRSDNVAAIQFYRSRGFHHNGTRARYYPDGCDALVLYRPADADDSRPS